MHDLRVVVPRNELINNITRHCSAYLNFGVLGDYSDPALEYAELADGNQLFLPLQGDGCRSPEVFLVTKS